MKNNHSVLEFTLKDVGSFIRAIRDDDIERYIRYWKTITPRDEYEYHCRYLFAITSVQMSWRQSIEIYPPVHDFIYNVNTSQKLDPLKLFSLLQSIHCGYYDRMGRSIREFNAAYWKDPSFYYPRNDETFVEMRNRIAKVTYGLGLAKTAFALEMCFPLTCDVTCLDRHMLRKFGFTGKTLTDAAYMAMEEAWRELCQTRGVPCPIARQLYYDKQQRKPDSRYWTYVLERS